MVNWSPTQLTNYNSQQAINSNAQQQQTGAQQNVYGAGQQQLQSQLPSLYTSFLQGNVPTSFTAPQQVLNAYQQQFQNMVAPGLATQFGAGSPQIGSQYNQGLTSLLGNLYQSGLGNYQNALNSAGSFALSPTGSVNQSTGNQTAAQAANTSGSQTAFMWPGLLNILEGILTQPAFSP